MGWREGRKVGRMDEDKGMKTGKQASVRKRRREAKKEGRKRKQEQNVFIKSLHLRPECV